MYTHMYVCQPCPKNFLLLTLELSDSENFTITIVGIVIFTIMNTVTLVDLLNIIIKHGFLKYYELSQV